MAEDHEGSTAYSRYRTHLDSFSGLRQLEDRFLQVASAKSARDAVKRYTATPHPAGSPASFDFAVRLLREWGALLGADVPSDVSSRVFQAGTEASREEMTRGCSSRASEDRARVWIDTYETLVTDPIRASLSLSKAGRNEPYWVADLNEAVLSDDPSSSQGAPPYHA